MGLSGILSGFYPPPVIDPFPDDPWVFRPPAEAFSLIVRLASGCPHNRCRFCAMYKESKFKKAGTDEIAGLLNGLSGYSRNRVKRIFLGDGDPMSLPTGHLEEVLGLLRDAFPRVTRITAYGSPKSLIARGQGGLERLRGLGLTEVYLGLESGSDEVLNFVDKGNTVDEFVAACEISKYARLKVSVTAILGLGGKNLSRAHSNGTSRAVNRARPNYFSILTLIPGGNGEFLESIVPMSRFELLDELRRIIAGIEIDTIFRNDHSSNFIDCNGRLQRDKTLLVSRLALAMAPGPQDPRLAEIPLFMGESSL